VTARKVFVSNTFINPFKRESDQLVSRLAARRYLMAVAAPLMAMCKLAKDSALTAAS
jgi:hypothetical protein